MAKKRKTLPKDFKELIEAKDIDALKAVFNKCELDAYGGYGKQTALSAFNVPHELVRWLVEQGLDINSRDIYGCTPLHNHASCRSGDVKIFLDLGADIELVDNSHDTALHSAAQANNLEAVKQLVAHGANVLAKNNRNQTPLEEAVVRASNIDIVNLEQIAKILLSAGTPITETMGSALKRIGEDFEFHRANFNKDYLEETSNAQFNLYAIFDVPPIPKRMMHDGISPIVPTTTEWKAQYAELWDLLIPSQGPAQTVQGEVMRITGKVRDELYRNGGANWNVDFRKMLNALLTHLASANALNKELLEEAAHLAKQIKGTGNEEEDPNRLCKLALEWVLLNPQPISLGEVPYVR